MSLAVCPGCGIGDSSICSKCINRALSERKRLLSELLETRSRLREQLDTNLEGRKKLEEVYSTKMEAEYRCKSYREEINMARRKLLKVKDQTLQKKSEFRARMERLRRGQKELQERKSDLLERYYPDLIQVKSLILRKLASDLNQLRQSTVSMLCKIFPMRMPVVDVPEGWDGSQKLTQSVRIRGVRLPNGTEPLSVHSKELSASLGYLVHFLALLSRYLSVPLLHSAGFALSTSHVWQRSSYSNHRPAQPSDKYPLFLPKSQAMDSRGDPSEPSPAPQGPAEYHLVSEQVLKRVKRGILLLHKSVVCLCADQSNKLGYRIPVDLAPFAALAVLMSAITQDMRWGNISESSTLERNSQERSMALFSSEHSNFPRAALLVGPAWNEGNSMAIGVVTQEEDSPGEAVSSSSSVPSLKVPDRSTPEDWDIVESLPLPPPPSREEDVEHWARAMFIDAKK